MTASYIGTIAHRQIHILNSIAAAGESEFYVTNLHYFTAREHPVLWAFETYLAPPLASVVHVNILVDGPVDAAVVAREAYPNGTVLLNDTTLAVASTSQRTVNLYAVSQPVAKVQAHPILKLESRLSLPFLPDNLAVSKSDGALFVAGHPYLPSLGRFARSRRICHRPDVFEKQGQEERDMCASISSVS